MRVWHPLKWFNNSTSILLRTSLPNFALSTEPRERPDPPDKSQMPCDWSTAAVTRR